MSNNNCIRILRIVSVMNRGGIETQIMNMYRKLDRNKYQFDFLVTREESGVFDQEIEELGGRIYRIPAVRKVGLLPFIKSIDNFFSNHKEYNIVHSHMNTWSGLFLGIAKKHGVTVRIAQSHSAQQGYKHNSFKEKIENLFKKLMRTLIKYNSTHFWAVGQDAGEWLFGKTISSTKMQIVPNAKDLDLFKFDEDSRKSIRNEFSISDNALLIGHVGNFTFVKNHHFIIDIFTEVIKRDDNVHLFLVGDGPLKMDIQNRVMGTFFEDNVHLLGTRNDINKLMSAFDILVLPSFFEGIPNVLIEAQAAGLSCLASDSITDEIDMEVGLVNYLNLSEKSKWISSIENRIGNTKRVNAERELKNQGYNLDSLMQWLENFYNEVYDAKDGTR